MKIFKKIKKIFNALRLLWIYYKISKNKNTNTVVRQRLNTNNSKIRKRV
jgi:hypothetical protein